MTKSIKPKHQDLTKEVTILCLKRATYRVFAQIEHEKESASPERLAQLKSDVSAIRKVMILVKSAGY